MTDQKRPYRMKRRAELEQQTRARITEAAVELHGDVGPSRTSMSAVAERAGVRRSTLYRHFPDEAALFAACSAH
jgi:AcrR family transcriptional regulator